MLPEDYQTARDIMVAGQDEIASSLKTERVLGPLRLAPFACGEGLDVVTDSPDTDLLVYVYSRPFDSGLAFASVCQRDQNGRPVSALMGLQTKAGSGPHMEPYSDATVTVIVHELYHAMGFSGGSWDEDKNRMLDEELNPRGTHAQQAFPFPAYGLGTAACEPSDASASDSDSYFTKDCRRKCSLRLLHPQLKF